MRSHLVNGFICRCRTGGKSQRGISGRFFAIRTLLIIVGVILLLSGLIFMGQGSRFFPYPAESFMVGASQWIYYGGGMAVIGVLLLAIAWRWPGAG